MKRNLDAHLVNHKGEPLKEGAGENAKTIPLHVICLSALMTDIEGERLSGPDKFAMYQLAGKVCNGGVVDLTTEELAKIKERVGKIYGIAVVGPAYKLLETDYVESAPVAVIEAAPAEAHEGTVAR
jgi:hypothetical protein